MHSLLHWYRELGQDYPCFTNEVTRDGEVSQPCLGTQIPEGREPQAPQSPPNPVCHWLFGFIAHYQPDRSRVPKGPVWPSSNSHSELDRHSIHICWMNVLSKPNNPLYFIIIIILVTALASAESVLKLCCMWIWKYIHQHMHAFIHTHSYIWTFEMPEFAVKVTVAKGLWGQGH